MGSAIAGTLAQADQVAAKGDFAAPQLIDVNSIDLGDLADPIRLPDGKVIYPPLLHGEPVHTVACGLLDMVDPAASKFLKLIGPPGTGKALALDTPIPTPDGWATMGDLRPGDHVFTPDGQPVRVLATSDVMVNRRCLEVSFSDGSSIVADADHLWVTDRRSSSGDWRPTPEPITTQQIAATINRHGRRHHAIPLAGPLQLPKAALPIDARVLGLWLGDDDSDYASISTADPALLAAFTDAGYQVQRSSGQHYTVLAGALRRPHEVACAGCGATIAPRRRRRWYCDACNATLSPTAKKLTARICACGHAIDRESWSDACRRCLNSHSLLVQLRELRLLGNKHIPTIYQRASIDQRRRLLSGLLDSDGTVSPTGAIEFTSTNRRLASDVHELICSLGYRAALREGRATLDGRQIGPKWTVSLTTNDDLFGLERKRQALAERMTATSEARRKYRYITAINEVPSVPVRCIQIDDPAGLFLAGRSMITTHNSQIARAIAHELWTAVRGKQVTERHGSPFYGFLEIAGGPSSDEFLFKYDYVPQQDGSVAMIEAAFVEAMRNGWVVMIDEVNTIRDVALLSLNATLDGRLSLYLPSTGETVVAQPGFAVILAYNPGLVGASDIPDAWYSRFPATLEVTSNWPALAELGAPIQLVAAARDLDLRRTSADNEKGLVWTPQFRDIEALWQMSDRVGRRAAVALFISNVYEQLQAGKVQAAEAEAVCRMLDTAGFGDVKISQTSGIAHLHGYPRAVTS